MLCLLIPVLVFAQEGNYSITKIANAGILITEGNQSILIDGLFEKVYDQFEVPNESAIQSILNKKGRFKLLEYVLVTHGHGDHYSENLVGELLAHQNAIALLPSELKIKVDTFIDEPVNNSHRSESVFYIDSTRYQPYDLDFETLRITSFSLPHTGGFELQNVCFLVTLKNGTRILHTGDGDLSQLNHSDLGWLWEEPVDIMIVPYFEIGGNVEVFKELPIQAILPVHFDLRIPDIEEKISEIEYDKFMFFPERGVLRY